VRRLAPLALLLLALLPAAASAKPLPKNFFGMMINGPLDSPKTDLMAEEGAMRAAGVESQRVPFNWDRIQRDPDAAPDWSEPDRKVLAAAANGMSVLGLVLGSPAWASVHPDIPLSPPKDPATYGNFMRLAIARYGPFGTFWTEHPEVPAMPVRAWQVWNEPNLSDYFSVQPFPKPYVRLLRAARKAIRSADPGAKVVMAGLANFSWKDLARLYRAHVKGLFDVAAVHPFSGFPINSVKIVRSNRRVMDRHGDRRKPIWLTELTWTSAKGKTKNIHNWETTPAGQARRLTRGYRLYVKERRKLRLQRIYWYTWAGYDSPPNSFDYSGLRHSTADGVFSDKPALAAFKRITRRYER
jgi:polysaccharide biosynthesis protein PslG